MCEGGGHFVGVSISSGKHVFAQRAADGAVGHLDQPLVDAVELGAAVANELGIDTPASPMSLTMTATRRLGGCAARG